MIDGRGESMEIPVSGAGIKEEHFEPRR